MTRQPRLGGKTRVRCRWSETIGLVAGLWVFPLPGRALEIHGVEPFALDLPRVPALVAPVDGGAPLTRSTGSVGQSPFALDCFLDTGASRVAVSRADRDALKIQSTGEQVGDYGIAGTEQFDVSIPYRIYLGDSTASTRDPRQFPCGMRCVLQLRRSDQNPLNALPTDLAQQLGSGLAGLGLNLDDLGPLVTPTMNVVGTPFLKLHVAILDPRPVETAAGALTGLTGGGEGGDLAAGLLSVLDQLLGQAGEAAQAAESFGRIRVSLAPAGCDYPPARLVVPLAMKSMDPKGVAVSHDEVPFVAGVILSHNGRTLRVNLLLDTGGGMSVISPKVAGQLGLDLAEPPLQAQVQGVGTGSADLKGYWIDGMTVPTAGPEPLVYQRVPFFVADVAGIDGTIGMNMLGPSIYLDMDLDRLMANPMSLLAGLRNGPAPFGRIVIDLPRGRLGLDPR